MVEKNERAGQPVADLDRVRKTTLRLIAEMLEHERPPLMPVPEPFNGWLRGEAGAGR